MINSSIEQRIKAISENGPAESDYPELVKFFSDVASQRKSNTVGDKEIHRMRKWFNGAMETEDTMQGHVCLKPYGYDGDFKIIQKIYESKVSNNPIYQKWDLFFHKGDAPKAVRNRKKYFLNKLKELDDNSSVLNLACGPCTDLLEFQSSTDKTLKFDCVDLDKNAIEYAKNKLSPDGNISFTQANIYKYQPSKKYDLIWSAGLFDYFNDKAFVNVLSRMSDYLKPNGKVIIGNFNEGINSQDYMEFGNWFLNYRSESKLNQLASVIDCRNVTIEREELNVNLFLNLMF